MKLDLVAAVTILAFMVPAVAQDSPRLRADASLTPGSVRTVDTTEVCAMAGTAGLRRWSRGRDDSILAEYGLKTGPHPDYEIDHLIPLSLGGADDDSNLWPQPRARIVEYRFSAEAKDHLEWQLYSDVCSGTISLEAAQKMIIRDWSGQK